MIGPHVLTPTDAAMAWARRAGIVKAVDDTRALREARPDAIKIFRHFFGQQDINRHGSSVVDEVLAALGDAPATHIELFNEIGVSLGHGLDRYVEMTQEAVDYCKKIRSDLTVIGYSFSTGTPEPIEWVALREWHFGGVSVIGMHEYWGNNIGFSVWNALRHTRLWNPGDPKITITECGRDAVEGGRGGWMKDGIASEAYAAELLAYDREIAKDAYVIGATPFTSGPTDDWRDFNIDPVSPLIPNSPPPSPGGPPVTPPTLPSKWTPGIDVSNHQKTIDWPLVARSGLAQFAVIKATEGMTYRDPYFTPNWKGAKNNGLVRGAYCYGKPSKGSGHADANYFLSLVTSQPDMGGIEQGDFLVLDLEDPDVAPNADLLAYAVDWFATIKDAVGFNAMLYSGHYYLAPHNLEGKTELKDNGLWLASYQTQPPPVPNGWDWWSIWQFSDRGVVPGIGNCDMDLFNGPIERLRLYGKQ